MLEKLLEHLILLFIINLSVSTFGCNFFSEKNNLVLGRPSLVDTHLVG